MNFLETLEQLNDWKKLPAYRAEPRVDFIVAGALPEIIKSKFNSNIEIIIPELPIRIGTIYNNGTSDKSYKVDFYILLESGRHLFIEFKTDSGSRRNKQDEYLLASQKVGMKAILDGVLKIYSATTYMTKYKYLIDKLESAKLITNSGTNYSPSNSQDEIEIIYIQPKAAKSNEIGFEEVSNIIGKSEDPIYRKFSEILLSWSDN
jgi:hypothetical protein